MSVAVCCRVLQCVAVCCCVLLCVAVCFSDSKRRTCVFHTHGRNMAHVTAHGHRHCNTLQQCSALQHAATHDTRQETLQHTATHCNTLQHAASSGTHHCTTLHHTATVQHTATHCNTLQHTATHCNTLHHEAYALAHVVALDSEFVGM